MAENETLLYKLLSFLFGTNNIASSKRKLPHNSNVKVSYRTLSDPDIEAEEIEEMFRSSKPVYPDLDYVNVLRPGHVHLHGTFQQLTSRFVRNGLRVTNGIFTDETGNVRIVWFAVNVAPLIKRGVVYELRGNYELKRGQFQISNPKFRNLDDGCESFDKITKKKEPKAPVPVQANVWTAPIGGRGLNPDSKWAVLRNKVFQRDNYTCVVCGSHTNLTVDHKLALKLGGTKAMSNLQTLCKDCHEDKHYRNFLDRKFDAMDDYGENYEPTVKIKTLSTALKDKTGVQISYTDRDGLHSYRVIHPKDIYMGYRYMGKIVNKKKVYVNAFCELDNADRTFRVSRMKLVKNTAPAKNTYS